jgi:hypothetical protein
MDDLRNTAQLVEFDPAAGGSIGTVISRAEIAEAAARDEYPATLLLDLDRVEVEDGGEVIAHARLALDFDKGSLEQLLASTDEPELGLLFNQRELARAFDDVEAQGLKQRAAVLAVAITAAGAATTPAFARIAPDVGGMGTSQSVGNTATQTGGQSAPTQLTRDQQIANAQATQAQSSTAVSSEATSSGGGMSSGEIAAIAGVGAVLISAAGFGVTRRRVPPVLPA